MKRKKKEKVMENEHKAIPEYIKEISSHRVKVVTREEDTRYISSGVVPPAIDQKPYSERSGYNKVWKQDGWIVWDRNQRQWKQSVYVYHPDTYKYTYKDSGKVEIQNYPKKDPNANLSQNWFRDPMGLVPNTKPRVVPNYTEEYVPGYWEETFTYIKPGDKPEWDKFRRPLWMDKGKGRQEGIVVVAPLPQYEELKGLKDRGTPQRDNVIQRTQRLSPPNRDNVIVRVQSSLR